LQGLTRPAPRRSAREAAAADDNRDDAASGRFALCLAAGDERQYDLMVVLDDAISAISNRIFSEEESTASSFSGLAEAIDKHGLFCEFCTYSGSHYFQTPRLGAGVEDCADAGRAAPAREASTTTEAVN